MMPQPAPVTGDAPGAPLSRSDQVRLAARARNTQRAYLGHWTRFRSWAQEQGLDLPGGPGGRPLRLPGPPRGGQQTHGHHPAGPGGHHQGCRAGGVAQARRPRRRGDDAGAEPDPPGGPETGGAPPRRGPGGDHGHRLHPPPQPGRSYRDGGIRPSAGLGRRRPGLRHARRAAAGLRGRRPALGGRGTGRRRQRPHPDSGVEDRSGGRGGWCCTWDRLPSKPC